MTVKKNTINMTEGPIFKNIILFAFPLLISNLLQLFYNAADIVVVSRYAGSYAMGSVGASEVVYTMLVGSVIGISVGTNVIVSRCFGAKDKEGIGRAIHTSVALAAVLGIVILIIATLCVKPLMVLLNTPKEILDGAVLYTTILFMGIPALFIYNFCAAIMRAMGDTRRPMYILVGSGAVNVILNLIFVILFKMDVAGVAIATITSQYLSAIIAFAMLVKGNNEYSIVPRKIRIHKKEVLEILRIGVPNAVSISLAAVSNALIVSSVNSFGANAASGYAAAVSIEGFIYMGMNAISQATLTAVSQNFGAKNSKRLFKCMRRCIYISAGVGFALGGIAGLFSRELLSIYITDNPEAVEFARLSLLITGVPYFVSGIMEVFSQTVRGLGYSTTATVNSIWTLVGTRIIWIKYILPLRHTPETLFLCWVVSWLIAIIAHSITLAVIKKKAMRRMLQQ